MTLVLPPTPPSAGRPQPTLAHRRLKRDSVSEVVVESASAKDDKTTLGMLPLPPLRASLQAAARGNPSKVRASSGEATPIEMDPTPIRFHRLSHANFDDSLIPSGSEEAHSTQTNAGPRSPVPPAYPSTRRPKRPATNDTAVQADAGASAILPESLHASFEECASGAEADMEGQLETCILWSSSAPTPIKYSNSEEAAATQTDTAWNEEAFRCAVCTPSQYINGCWRVCSSVDAHGLQKDVAPWLTRICVSNLNFVRDGEGRRLSLKVCNQGRFLAGGVLHLDENGILHRYGKSGSHACFFRDQQHCQAHSALLCPIVEVADEE